MPEYPAGWQPDPTKRHQYRYWDGNGWTEHVATNGATATDPLPSAPGGSTSSSAAAEDDSLGAEEVQGILAEVGVEPARAGDGTLFGEPVLVYYQWMTDVAEGYRYSILNPAGAVVGRCHEVVTGGPDAAEASFGELMDHANTGRFAFYEPSGRPWAGLAHKKVWKSKITMVDPAGQQLGSLNQENVLGKVRLGLEAGGGDLGEIVSDNTKLLGFTITDAAKNPIGRILKLGSYARPGVLGPKKLLGCYVLRLDARPAQPLHSLLAAAPVAIDLAFNVNQAGYRSLGRALAQDE